jgi:hypothetical protein
MQETAGCSLIGILIVFVSFIFYLSIFHMNGEYYLYFFFQINLTFRGMPQFNYFFNPAVALMQALPGEEQREVRKYLQA